MFQIGTRGFSSVMAERFWKNVPYVMVEKPYQDLLVHKVRLYECGEKPRVLGHVFARTIKESYTLGLIIPP